MLRLHYERLAEGYVAGLKRASDDGDITIGDPVVTAWALMAVGEMIGLRWILWGDTREVPPEVFREAMSVVARVLGVTATPEDLPTTEGPVPGDDDD